MTDRFPITNLLLLLLLAGFLLVSGSLQCAFDCLTQADHGHSAAVRVDDCHITPQQPDPISICANKACHQGSPQHHNLGAPQLFSLTSLAQPLSGPSRVQLPLLRTGTPLLLALTRQPALLANYSPDLTVPSQQVLSLRTTVLLN